MSKTSVSSHDDTRGFMKETRPVEVVLEGVLLQLGRCSDLVRPAGLLQGVVQKKDWVAALRELELSIRQIRTVCDPDRPLRPAVWGKLLDGSEEKPRSALELSLSTPKCEYDDANISEWRTVI